MFEFIQKKQTFRREDFIKNLIAALGEQGLINRPAFRILKNEIVGMARNVEIEINNEKLFLSVSFDGLEVNKVYSAEEYKKISIPKSREQVRVELAALLEQLKQFDTQENK
jgi:hypothetical protein